MCSTSITSFILKGLFMKIRKGLLAAATAATVSFSGVVAAPAFAETNNEPTQVTDQNSGKDEPGKDKGSSSNGEGPSQTAKDMFYEQRKDGTWYISPSKITSWIAVFTAALGAIGTLLTFVQKNFDVKF